MNPDGFKRRRIGCDAAGAPLPGTIDEQRRFHIGFRAEEHDIDELGHVNNAVWVTWIQDASVAHWFAASRPCDTDAFVAVVLRHEVDYRGNVRSGEDAIAITWVGGQPRGARYWRRVDFTDDKGGLFVSALSQWALIEKASGKLIRVPAEVAVPFQRDATGQEITE